MESEVNVMIYDLPGTEAVFKSNIHILVFTMKHDKERFIKECALTRYLFLMLSLSS